MHYKLNIDERVKSSKKVEENWDLPVYVEVSGKISEESAKNFRNDMKAAEIEAGRSKQEVIPIVIDSPGGCVYSLLSMIDVIQTCDVPVATIIEGKAMSAGVFLFSCGTEGRRYISPNATIMIHEISTVAIGKNEDIKVSQEQADKLNTKLFEIMSTNCGKHPSYFYDIIKKEKYNADWFLDAQEAVTHNIANHIHVPKFTVDIKMDINFR